MDILVLGFLGYLVVGGIILLIVFLISKKKKSNGPPQQPQTAYVMPTIATPNPEEYRPDYSKKYQKRLLLTKNEWYEWRKLKVYAEQKGLTICTKVRLLDLLEPRRGESDYMSLLGKIQSKHVDFVICDRDLRVKAILELDDNSHNQQDRQNRDEFVDQVLTSVGYTVIRTRSITEHTLDCITPN